MTIVFALYKTTIVFIVLLILTRILGKKQMGQLTFFNYITGITIGSIASNIVSKDGTFISQLSVLACWCLLTGVTGYIGLKSGKIRSIIDGEPIIVIKNSHLMKKDMKKMRLNMDDLTMLLREQNIFSITDVEYAILEPNGKLSVMKKQPKQQVVKEDMKIPLTTMKYLPSEIIVDGKIVKHNLLEMNLSEEWVNRQLKKQNIKSINDVFYAEIESDGNLFVEKN